MDRLSEDFLEDDAPWARLSSIAFGLILLLLGAVLLGHHSINSWPLLAIAASAMVVRHVLDPQPCTSTARIESRS